MRKLNLTWQIRIFFILFMIILLIFAKSPFNFLILNTILGYIPIELCFHLLKFKSTKSIFFWLLLVLWLLFFPNAPYLLTDLFHLSLLNPHIGNTGLLRSTPSIWFNFALLLTGALSCSLIAINQLHLLSAKIQQALAPRIKITSIIFATVVCILSSVGIYMGRFLRIHSLYMLLTPTWFFKQIMGMWTMDMLKFTAILTICQLLIYWLIYVVQNANQDHLHNR